MRRHATPQTFWPHCGVQKWPHAPLQYARAAPRRVWRHRIKIRDDSPPRQWRRVSRACVDGLCALCDAATRVLWQSCRRNMGIGAMIVEPSPAHATSCGVAAVPSHPQCMHRVHHNNASQHTTTASPHTPWCAAADGNAMLHASPPVALAHFYFFPAVAHRRRLHPRRRPLVACRTSRWAAARRQVRLGAMQSPK